MEYSPLREIHRRVRQLADHDDFSGDGTALGRAPGYITEVFDDFEKVAFLSSQGPASRPLAQLASPLLEALRELRFGGADAWECFEDSYRMIQLIQTCLGAVHATQSAPAETIVAAYAAIEAKGYHRLFPIDVNDRNLFPRQRLFRRGACVNWFFVSADEIIPFVLHADGEVSDPASDPDVAEWVAENPLDFPQFIKGLAEQAKEVIQLGVDYPVPRLDQAYTLLDQARMYLANQIKVRTPRSRRRWRH